LVGHLQGGIPPRVGGQPRTAHAGCGRATSTHPAGFGIIAESRRRGDELRYSQSLAWATTSNDGRRARSHVRIGNTETGAPPRQPALPCSTDQTNRSNTPIDGWQPARSLVGFVRVPLPRAATAERARQCARSARRRPARISARDQVVARGGGRRPPRPSFRCSAGRFGNGFGLGARLARAVQLKFGTAAGCGHTYTRAHRMGLR